MVQTRSATAAARAAAIERQRYDPFSNIIEFSKYSPLRFRNGKKLAVKNWNFGYNAEGIVKTRIIVKLEEGNGKKWVHQFDKHTPLNYYCFGCLKKERIINYGEYINGKFYAPTFHYCIKVCAKKNAAEQLKRERKAALIRYTHSNPRYQEFTFPTPLIRYLICNPKTHEAYDKLVKSCKWFYHRNKLTLVQRIIRTQIADDIVLIEGPPIEWDINKTINLA